MEALAKVSRAGPACFHFVQSNASPEPELQLNYKLSSISQVSSQAGDLVFRS